MTKSKTKALAKRVIFGNDALLRLFRLHVQPAMRRPSRTESVFLAMDVKCDVFVDVGANIGLYSIMMRKNAQKTLSFEPIPENVRQLKALQIPNMTVHPFCLGSEAGETLLRIPLRDGALMTGLATVQSENPLDGEQDIVELPVKVMAFDDLWREGTNGCLDLVKIDVEGYELFVIRGMMETLKAERPILLIEIEGRHNPQGFREIFDTLAGIGYSPFYSPDGETLQRLSDPRPEVVQAEDESNRNYYNNFFFLQPAHIDTYASFIAGD
ncbi:MAG: FkbM family methyltransferase [Roseovarius sp.]